MSRLDIATVLLQWATGGLLFLWVTTRHRLVGLGYGWLLRGVFGVMAIGAVLTNGSLPSAGRTLFAGLCALATVVALGVSVQRKAAGVSGGRAEAQRKAARVAAMTGRGPAEAEVGEGGVGDAGVGEAEVGDGEPATAAILMRDQFGRVSKDVERVVGEGPEFPPVLDLVAPALGFVGLVFAGVAAVDGNGNALVSVLRVIVGALFLGAVSDAMLLGHWYLTQPGLSRRPIVELNDWLLRLWPLEVAVMLIPTGMISVITGAVDDHWGGVLGWMWIACALTTGIMAFVTRIILRERYYSAVMAATGMLYLAILTAFGTDIVARLVLQN